MIGKKIEVNIGGGLNIKLPNMVQVRQKFQTKKIDNVTEAVKNEFLRPDIKGKVKPGMKIAVGVGSRGVANIAECAKAVVTELKSLGATPFIFPAMGSHGGATADGQKEVLESYGINESHIGCPIISDMTVEKIGELEGMPVYVDKTAATADGIVLIPRIKPHTSFRAPIESGIVKMLTIGMGKIDGATTLHSFGMDVFGELLPKTAKFVIAKKNFLFGLAMLENAADETASIEAVTGDELFDREPELQTLAKSLMPSLQFDEIDVLVIEKIGKNISGSGMDPNITGRNGRGVEWDMRPHVKKIAVLELTPETHGNATGIGGADVITMKLYKSLDISKTYANIITSTYLDGGAIPIIMNTDEEAIRLAAKTVVRVKPEELKIVRIANTLEIVDIQVSTPMLNFVKSNPEKFEIQGSPQPFKYDTKGNLYPMLGKVHENILA